jgi:peptidoglycan/LPS O-acetylase OafA/YrhL
VGKFGTNGNASDGSVADDTERSREVRRWPHLDGLRAAAAGLVLLSHVGFWTGATAHGFLGAVLARGDSGVAVFFALSAFLLAGPWWLPSRAGTEHRTDPGTAARTRTYAVRRAARLLPAYTLALAAVLAAAAFGLGGGLHSVRAVLAHLVLVQGYTGDSYQAFSQTWSLTTEVTFYLLLPLAAPLVARMRARSPGAALVWCGALALLGFLVQAAVAPRGGSTLAAAVATSVLGHAAWFAVGIAVLVLRTRALPHRATSWARLATASPGTMLLVGLTAYALATTALAGPRGLVSPTASQALVKELLYAVFAGALLLAATSPAGPLAQVLDTRIARWLGERSYGIFLWHLLALQLVYALTGLALFGGAFTLVLVAVVTLTVLAASLSWSLLERPVLRWAHARTRSSTTVA